MGSRHRHRSQQQQQQQQQYVETPFLCAAARSRTLFATELHCTCNKSHAPVAESSGAAEAADKVQRARKGRIVDDGEQPERRQSAGSSASAD
jgi:hypothetical protein